MSALSGFKTTYTVSGDESKGGSTKHVSSWTAGAQESINAGGAVGDLANTGVGSQFSVTFKAAQQMKGETDTENGTFSDDSFNISSSSDLGDEFWTSSKTLYLWIYPVIGKSACPAAKPNCNPDEEQPITLVYSAPADIQNTNDNQSSSTGLYQPVWAYGNIFSYPTNFTQLSRLVPGIQELGGKSDSTSTASGDTTVYTTWTQGGQSTASTGLEGNFSFEVDTSYQAGAGVPKIATVNWGASFNISGSYGFSNLSTQTTKVSSSTGLTISKPAGSTGFLNPTQYGYKFTPYIFGRIKPDTVTDSSNTVDPSAAIQTFGALRSAFTADVTPSDAGPFWRERYAQAPDIGLAHPSRWVPVPPASVTPPARNCALNGSDCFDVGIYQPDDPWSSTSQSMQGFFITDARSSPPGGDATPAGPNLGTVVAGTPVTLYARVYNFSLANMAAGTQAFAQFYGMVWDTQTNKPIGSSFKIGPKDPATGQIGNIALGQIPAVNSGADLNWLYARTSFDTTAYADKHLVFWVVVWAETGSGANRALMTEIPGHGLTALPADVLSGLAQVPLEMNRNVANNATVTYSNNVGVYHRIFYVANPPTAETRTLLSTTADSSGTKLEPVLVSTTWLLPKQPLTIAVKVKALGSPSQGANVHFYDGHPQEGGKLIQVEHLSWIRAGESHEARIVYRPQTPGLRRIWAVLDKQRPSEAIRASRVVCVGESCRPRGILSSDDTAQERPDPREKY